MPPCDEETGNTQADQNKWTVFILEDAEELISADAKNEVGQGLGQLFNVTDGLIGQGLKILFIITTNTKIEKFHPAIIRPGRCLVRHEFSKFGAKETKQWFKTKKAEHLMPGLDHEYTLAELYDILNKNTLHSDKNHKARIGFAPIPEDKDGITT